MLRWTNPCFNAALDDSGRSYCEIGQDSLHNLGSYELWGQPSYGGGFRRLLERSVIGRECRPESVQVDLLYPWAGWHYYLLFWDLSGNPAPCASNVVYVPGSQVTGIDLPPASSLLIAEPVWFDVHGRRLSMTPRGSGVYFLVWRVRGQLQKPASKVTFVDGRPINLPIPRWALE